MITKDHVIKMGESLPRKGKEGKENEKQELIAFLLVRGISHVGPERRFTLESLKLKKKHSLVIARNDPSIKGMILSLKDLGVWAELSEKSVSSLLSERKPSYSSEALKVFNLSPPRGGFKKSIKKPQPRGVLGKMDEASFINLLSRMI